MPELEPSPHLSEAQCADLVLALLTDAERECALTHARACAACEERLRLQEADLRARAEQEARLKEEQMRLDAQVKLAEKKAKPVWLFAVLGLLVVGLGIGGW